MKQRDGQGLALSGASGASIDHYETALGSLRCFTGDPIAAAEAAIRADPGFVMAHVFKGYMYGLSTEASAMPVARACAEAAASLPANARERGHVAALTHLAAGRWHLAGQTLEDLTIEFPTDALALQAGHQIDFFTGNSRMLRDRIARALPAWDEAIPGYHAMLGMHAFGLEEMGEYDRAERSGKKAVDLEPRDGWAQHAVAHVMEMQCRQAEGISWMRQDTEAWSRDSFLQVHNWWHLALFHFDLGQVDDVLALYDGPIAGGRSEIALNMVDASAILWRLHLTGADVGSRWNPLADKWEKQAGQSAYAFNDAHAMMAFIGAERHAAAEVLLEAQQHALASAGDNSEFTRDVGQPVALAIHAFGKGDYTETVRLLRPIRHIAHRFGGSHAQRDAIDLTLVEATIRSGNSALSRALAAERFHVRPDSPLSKLFVRRAEILPNEIKKHH